jgi:hypothetical protein
MITGFCAYSARYRTVFRRSDVGGYLIFRVFDRPLSGWGGLPISGQEITFPKLVRSLFSQIIDSWRTRPYNGARAFRVMNPLNAYFKVRFLWPVA